LGLCWPLWKALAIGGEQGALVGGPWWVVLQVIQVSSRFSPGKWGMASPPPWGQVTMVFSMGKRKIVQAMWNHLWFTAPAQGMAGL